MESRIKTMKEACRDYGLDQAGNDSLHKPNAWEYLINKEHHLVWCNVFKAGSTRYFDPQVVNK
jgi:chondroitin 4-sulfotransferase 11